MTTEGEGSEPSPGPAIPLLDSYLRHPPPGYAFLLSGNWGVGKSFFWSRYKRRLAQFGMTPIAISAAGLQTSEDLERAFFQASINNVGRTQVREAGAVIGRALLRFVKIDPDDIKLKAAVTGGKTVVSIDDVERFAGDFKVLFGFIVNVIDEEGTHCILIADEEKATHEHSTYAEYKERIVGRTVRLRPDLRSFCDETIRGFAEDRSREILLANIGGLIQMLEERRVENLRTVRFLLTELYSVLRSLPLAATANEPRSLFSAMAFYVLAVARNTGNEALVSKAFSTAELGIVLAMRERTRDAEGDEPIDRLVQLLAELKFTSEAHEWPQSRAFIDLIEGRVVDYQDLANDFGLREASEADDSTAKNDSLEALQHYRSLTDEQLRKHTTQLMSEVQECRYRNLSRFFESYRVIYWLAKNGLTVETPEEWTQESLEALSKYKPAELSPGDIDFWMGPYDDNETRVIEALKVLQAERNALLAAEKRELDRAQILATEGVLPGSTEGPIFSDISAEEFFGRLQASESIDRMTRFFRLRMQVMNAPDFVGEDRNFAAGLAEIIEQNVPDDRPLSIRDSLLSELAKTLQKFVGFVDAYRGGARA